MALVSRTQSRLLLKRSFFKGKPMRSFHAILVLSLSFFLHTSSLNADDMRDSLKGLNKVKVEPIFNGPDDLKSLLSKNDIINLIHANIKAAGMVVLPTDNPPPPLVPPVPEAIVRVVVTLTQPVSDGAPVVGTCGVRIDIMVRQQITLVRNNNIKIWSDTWWRTKSGFVKASQVNPSAMTIIESSMKELIDDRRAAGE